MKRDGAGSSQAGKLRRASGWPAPGTQPLGSASPGRAALVAASLGLGRASLLGVCGPVSASGTGNQRSSVRKSGEGFAKPKTPLQPL